MRSLISSEQLIIGVLLWRLIAISGASFFKSPFSECFMAERLPAGASLEGDECPYYPYERNDYENICDKCSDDVFTYCIDKKTYDFDSVLDSLYSSFVIMTIDGYESVLYR